MEFFDDGPDGYIWYAVKVFLTLDRDDSKLDMTAMAKNYNFYSFMNFKESYQYHLFVFKKYTFFQN